MEATSSYLAGCDHSVSILHQCHNNQEIREFVSSWEQFRHKVGLVFHLIFNVNLMICKLQLGFHKPNDMSASARVARRRAHVLSVYLADSATLVYQ